MKKILILLLLVLLLLPLTTHAAIMDTVRGMILLQVENNGEAWYVYPADNSRYYMKDGAVAYQLMRNFGLGITDLDLNKIPSVADTTAMKNSTSVCYSNSLANRVKGKILLQVEQHGEAWYIYPKTCRRIYLKDGAAAYEIMRFLGLGITNVNLASVPVSDDVSAGFKSCLETKKYLDKVNADQAAGVSLGVSGTPTSFIGGEMVSGYHILSEWQVIIDSYLFINDDLPVKIDAYSDYQCPFCALQHQVFNQLLTQYPNLTIELHHFPLSFHDQSANAALAAECAREQGKFDQMSDALFQLNLDRIFTYDNILKKAGELGL